MSSFKSISAGNCVRHTRDATDREATHADQCIRAETSDLLEPPENFVPVDGSQVDVDAPLPGPLFGFGMLVDAAHLHSGQPAVAVAAPRGEYGTSRGERRGSQEDQVLVICVCAGEVVTVAVTMLSEKKPNATSHAANRLALVGLHVLEDGEK
eukprot:CAMPEP_0183589144 /NCGR_PEP_ID=MMETSP0371-20130417/162148_1 /TAXON_ID=268820 /ORGANISM="Peridinium aciculiferum, Strain PAER-2" /LENGTH=152 /DNA_ID=CAMNT_0025800445 /DNA_START=8 /DNA_END=463 /DNA_ORIENTATION=-